jgi:hypothetical protein
MVLWLQQRGKMPASFHNHLTTGRFASLDQVR